MVDAWGMTPETASGGSEALDKMSAFSPDVIVTDLNMDGMDGYQLLEKLRESGDSPPAIVLTAFGNIETAVKTVKDLGAYWFLEKPVQAGVLQVLLRRAAAHSQLTNANRNLQRQLQYKGAMGELVGASAKMQEIFSLLQLAGPTNACVLISGESGTGKELAARTIHALNPRRQGPFFAINCAALPESLIESELFGHEKGSFTGAAERRAGCFEVAQNGTLLLDEIGEMPAPTQAKLFRVLEDRKVRRLGSKVETPVDVRVVAATNKDPEQAVSSAHLRQDLYFRLNVFHIHLPPLREHREDIPLLTEYILRDINTKHGKNVKGVGAEVMDIFMSHTWPGNIRELRNVLERSTIMCEKDLITRACLPDEFGKSATKSPSDLSALKFPIGTTVDAMERELILQTLSATGNNKTRAAELLGISLKTLHNKLKEYGGERAEGE